MPAVACPRCGQPMDRPTTVRHCPKANAVCTWIRHACGAVVDARKPTRFIPYNPRSSQ